jgi:hypothetical protein
VSRVGRLKIDVVNAGIGQCVAECFRPLSFGEPIPRNSMGGFNLSAFNHAKHRAIVRIDTGYFASGIFNREGLQSSAACPQHGRKGTFATRGFLGDYEIEVKGGSKTKTVRVSLPKEAPRRLFCMLGSLKRSVSLLSAAYTITRGQSARVF